MKILISNSNDFDPFPLFIIINHRFNPARWLDPTKKLRTSPPFLSFLTGPHRCLAKAMALMQMKIVISCVDFRHDTQTFHMLFLRTLISSFEFEPAYQGQHVDGTPLSMYTFLSPISLPKCLSKSWRMVYLYVSDPFVRLDGAFNTWSSLAWHLLYYPVQRTFSCSTLTYLTGLQPLAIAA